MYTISKKELEEAIHESLTNEGIYNQDLENKIFEKIHAKSSSKIIETKEGYIYIDSTITDFEHDIDLIEEWQSLSKSSDEFIDFLNKESERRRGKGIWETIKSFIYKLVKRG